MVKELTRERILEMEAGRELDALIAERLLRWSGVHCATGGGPYGPMEGYTPHGDPTGGHGVANRPVPHFSTSIADAWEILEKAKAFTIAFWPEDHADPFGQITAGYTCCYFGEKRFDRMDRQPSICLAICRAALLTTPKEE